MEKLNDYLRTLLSTCSYELHLEPNKTPYVVNSKGTSDIANMPLPGTQISMMVFPLIPKDVKMKLPNQSEVEFVYTHDLGKFNFLVKKSPAGFVVTIRPVISEEIPKEEVEITESHKGFPSDLSDLSEFSSYNQKDFSSSSEAQTYSFKGISSSFETNLDSINMATNSYPSEIEIEADSEFKDNFPDYSQPQIEVVPVNDPEFQTTFSDSSNYEPPGKRQDFESIEYIPPAENFAQTTMPHSFETFTQTQMSQAFQGTSQGFQSQPSTSPMTNYDSSIEKVAAGFTPAQANLQAQARMDALFRKMSEIGASDLHLSVSMPPMVRKDGKMQPLPCDEQILTPETMRELLTSIMPPKNQEEFARRNDTDFAYEIPDLARFRANIFRDRKGMGGVFRIIPTKILTAQQLGLSPAIMSLCELSKGLVVVTGPTGSGKSTTLCAMIDHINKTRDDHIITIEDPIEFVHENQRCLVNQREVHNHTDSFKDALRAALREDPDILLVGEMRDLETISIAIETAETGHLVFGTLHTTTAASTVDRIIDQFPADRQQQIRVMLSESLKGVIAQTLLPKKGGGRIAALEVLIVTPAISNLIREGKTFQIPSAMQTGKAHGMVVLNDALFALVQNGLVEPRDAYIKAVDKTGFETLLKRGGFKI